MVLNSQINRGSGMGQFGGGRRRRRKRITVILALAAIGFSVWFFGLRDRDDDANPAGPQHASAGGVLPAPVPPGAIEPAPAPRGEPPLRTRRATPPEPAPRREPARPAQPTDTTPEPERPTANRASQSSPDVARLIDQGRRLITDNQPVEGRKLLNQALAGRISRSDANAVRREMAQLNEVLVFSPRIVQGDPLVETYVVQPGDVLQRIARNYDVPWEFIAHINGIARPELLRAGQRLKIVRGPFHAVVHKDAFRMDVYLQDMFVRSYNVGLGEHGSTPIGAFVVRRQSKLQDPEWTNPRTGQRYAPSDPKNPLGGYWIGLRGTDAETELLQSYGIHGTIEPETIGREASMGCVRLIPADVAEVYKMLIEEKSTVEIKP
jgi:LysM repeat protein